VDLILLMLIEMVTDTLFEEQKTTIAPIAAPQGRRDTKGQGE
jgi:hypothetical protein